jgi:Glucose / Sorbosone dehydrogenase
MKRAVWALLLILTLLAAGSARAAALQSIGGFDEPIYVTSDPGNPERLFVVERGGRVIEVEGSRSVLYADLTGLVGCGDECAGERGLLSIALSPDFDSSGRLYADYAAESDGAIHVVELHSVTAGAALIRGLLTIPHPGESNHYGGQLQFAPEGNLFISTGDGGGADDEHHNAQNLETLLGKVLRIDPSPSGVLPYTVPAGNPFVGKPGRDEIWSYGLRNPFRFSFDRTSGAIAIGDVGQGSREEVDYEPAPGLGTGANYGWNCREGLIEGPATDEGCGSPPPGGFTEPIFDYPHVDPEDGGAYGCAIIGGYVVRDPGLTDLYGRYLYGDLCSGKLRSFSLAAPFASDRSEGIQVPNLYSFGEDSCGRLYAVSGNGQVSRLVGATPTDCTRPRPPLAYSFAGIRAKTRVVKKGKHALISAWVAPCGGRRGQPITLYRGRVRIGTRHLDRVCSARFRPRISRRGKYRATVRADAKYIEATSRKLTIRVRHRHRAR